MTGSLLKSPHLSPDHLPPELLCRVFLHLAHLPFPTNLIPASTKTPSLKNLISHLCLSLVEGNRLRTVVTSVGNKKNVEDSERLLALLQRSGIQQEFTSGTYYTMCSSWIFDLFFGANKPVVKELWIFAYRTISAQFIFWTPSKPSLYEVIWPIRTWTSFMIHCHRSAAKKYQGIYHVLTLRLSTSPYTTTTVGAL